MKKVIVFVLMLSLVLSGAFCYAYSATGTENMKGKDGIPVELIEKSTYGSPEKGNAIIAEIDGHYLTVIFTENLGQVSVEVTTITGGPVETVSMTTPNGQVLFIALAGDYIVNFTLSNGDEYFGEFMVTD